MNGYFAVGIYRPKREVNVGGLVRSAHCFGASMVFTIGKRYRREASDTTKAEGAVPFIHFETFDEFRSHVPSNADLVGVEMAPDSVALSSFVHPKRAVYLFGAEDHGLPAHVLGACGHVVEIESANPWSLNVASAGTVVLHDRFVAKAVNA